MQLEDWAMNRKATFACMLSAIMCAPSSLAQTLSVDWKFYGTAPTDGGYGACFYDAKGIVSRPNGYLRVWTKCLPIKDIDSIDIKKDFDGKILENTAQKIIRSYVPPLATVETAIDFDQAMVITQYEETANLSSIQPLARIFYEINCSEQMLRELSISVRVEDKFGSRDRPEDWKYVAPETNGARMLKILCRR